MSQMIKYRYKSKKRDIWALRFPIKSYIQIVHTAICVVILRMRRSADHRLHYGKLYSKISPEAYRFIVKSSSLGRKRAFVRSMNRVKKTAQCL